MKYGSKDQIFGFLKSKSGPPLEWRFAGGPMVARLCILDGILFETSLSGVLVFHSILITQIHQTMACIVTIVLNFVLHFNEGSNFIMLIVKILKIFLTITVFLCLRVPDKSAYWKTIFLISHSKHLLWALKRAV